MQRKYLLLLALICAPVFAQQTVNGNLIQTGTMPLNKIVTQPAGTTVCNPVGAGTVSPIACTASQAAGAIGATNANTPNAIVQRDNSGNFSAGTISAAVNGNATSATTAGFATTAGTANSATTAGTATSVTGVGVVTDTNGALANKPSVGVVADATTGNLTLSGIQTIDGVTGTAGTTIVLATAQTIASQNGPWVMQSGAWTPPTWYPSGGTTQAFQFISLEVRLGTTYQGSLWKMTTPGAITIGTTATTWVITPRALNASTVAGALPLANLPTQANGTVLGNMSGSTAVPSANNTLNMSLVTTNPVNASKTADGIAYSLTSNQTGGTAGAVQSAIHGSLYTGTGATSYGWAGVFEAHNQTTTAIGNTVGMDSLGEMINSGGGPTWGMVSFGKDSSGVADTPQHLFGAEIDIGATGTDANSNRYGLVMVGTGTNAAFYTAGIRIGGIHTSTGGGACYASCSTFISGLQLAGNFTTGLDLTLGAYTGNALQLSTSTYIGLDGTGGTHTFGYTTGLGMTFFEGGNAAVQIGDVTGTVNQAILLSPGASGSGGVATIRSQAGHLRVQAGSSTSLLLGSAANGDSVQVLDCGAACSNELSLKGATVGNPVVMGVVPASDTNVDIDINPAGTGRVVTDALNVSGAISKSNIGTTGARIYTTAATVTDTGSSGTVAVGAVNTLSADTLAASSATTFTRAATLYIAGAPIAGTNVTSGNGRGILVGGGALTELQGGLTVSGGGTTLSGSALKLSPNTLTFFPLQFQSGSLNTTATAGAWEYDGTNFYATPTGTTRYQVALDLGATTASIGGGSIANGACVSGTVAVTNSATTMAVVATPATYPGDGFSWNGYVSAAGTITVKVCNATGATGTPTASVYNVRVIQ